MTFAHGQELVRALLPTVHWVDTADVDRQLREAVDAGLIHRVGSRPEFTDIERFAGLGGFGFADLLRSGHAEHFAHLWGYSHGPDPNPPPPPPKLTSYEPCVRVRDRVPPWLLVERLYQGVEIAEPYPFVAPDGLPTYWDAQILTPERKPVWHVDADTYEPLQLVTLRDIRDRFPAHVGRRRAVIDLDTVDRGDDLDPYVV